jgi:hypothetical protein
MTEINSEINTLINTNINTDTNTDINTEINTEINENLKDNKIDELISELSLCNINDKSNLDNKVSPNKTSQENSNLNNIISNVIDELVTLPINNNQNNKKKNKGTGAGGKNTNFHGIEFENLTNNEKNLIKLGFIKNKLNKKNYFLSHKFDDYEIIFTLKYSFKVYIKKIYKIDSIREPDEAYIIKKNNDKKIYIKIIEKKEQNVEGSVENKLWCAPSFKREYQLLLGQNFIIDYSFVLSNFFKNKFNDKNNTKYITLDKILKENNIKYFFGDDEDYFDKIYEYINNFNNS